MEAGIGQRVTKTRHSQREPRCRDYPSDRGTVPVCVRRSLAIVSIPDAATSTAGYVHSGHVAASDAFNRRTVERDASLFVQHLRPGMPPVDLGCGAESLTRGVANLVVRGEVLGVDVSDTAIGRARELAEQFALTNVQFSVADTRRSGSATRQVQCNALSRRSDMREPREVAIPRASVRQVQHALRAQTPRWSGGLSDERARTAAWCAVLASSAARQAHRKLQR
ncbi:MAG: methyltransferase domain-containing protein [Chloroflexi bacterium]|nr:methyltransferase domain-containing protein [Chloroflexota bacterium]